MITIPRIILISLAVFGDVVSVLPAGRKQAWKFWFGDSSDLFPRKGFVDTLGRLLLTEDIERIIEKGRVRIKITPRGLKRLSLFLDLEKFSRKKWDKKWRLVVFDIEEKHKSQRDKIRSKLKSLGFGMLQESVWISPFPIEGELVEYFGSWKIKGEVLVSKSEVLVGDQKGIAWRVWQPARLEQRYLGLKKFWEDLPKVKQNKKNALRFEEKYFGLLYRDPFLPEELLPADWPAEKVKDLYLNQVRKVLFS